MLPPGPSGLLTPLGSASDGGDAFALLTLLSPAHSLTPTTGPEAQVPKQLTGSALTSRTGWTKAVSAPQKSDLF